VFLQGRSPIEAHSFLAQLQHNIDVLHILKVAVELDNVRMVKAAVDGYLLGGLFLLIVLDHQLLGDDFACKDIVGLHIYYLVAFCKAALGKYNVFNRLRNIFTTGIAKSLINYNIHFLRKCALYKKGEKHGLNILN